MTTNNSSSTLSLFQRITTTIYGLQIAADKYQGATEALGPMFSDGALLASILAAAEQGVQIPAEITGQAELWLSHAEQLLAKVE